MLRQRALDQIFKSGFETKGAAQSALRKAIAEYETKSGKLIEEIGLLGRPTWAFVLGEKTAGGFESRSVAEQALKAEIDRQQAQMQPAASASAPILKISHPMANKRVILPKLPKRRPPVLDKEKLRALFDRARGTRLYPLLVMASATGCRRGESNGPTLTKRPVS